MNIVTVTSANNLLRYEAQVNILQKLDASIIQPSNEEVFLSKQPDNIITGATTVTLALGEEEEVPYAKRIDFESSDTVIYQGWANTGSITSQGVWRINKTTFINSEGDAVVEWADGNANFDNTWDDRLSLSYS